MNLLDTLYNPSAVLPPEGSGFEQLLNAIKYHEASSQMYILLARFSKLHQTPEYFQEQLKLGFDEIFYKNLFIHSQTNKILKEFEKWGIDVIPLKGTYYSKDYYGHIGARPTSDIDLLIKEKDITLAIEAVQSLGFINRKLEDDSHFHRSYYQDIPGSAIPLCVEIHWGILMENTASLRIEKFWENAAAVDTFQHVKALSPFYTFYMICLHGWRHNLDSLKYYMDIIQLILVLKEELDYVELLEEARKDRTLKRIVRTLSLVYEALPYLHEIKEFPYKKQVRFRNQIVSKITKPTLKDYLDYVDYQFFSFDTARHSFLEVKNWLKSLG
ncbi:nucleotidyltransferase family protein [Peribacillus kribbensis]|uniref:nucleotidyltransferase family protein n=1 Tax=Peribacillus kribbensis TaxID=356658 RepID=UPI0004169A6E|nr:nucleotidyltransferase family protein [Peribacillus kribbensis]